LNSVSIWFPSLILLSKDADMQKLLEARASISTALFPFSVHY
jgi:hypothetical protein